MFRAVTTDNQRQPGNIFNSLRQKKSNFAMQPQSSGHVISRQYHTTKNRPNQSHQTSSTCLRQAQFNINLRHTLKEPKAPPNAKFRKSLVNNAHRQDDAELCNVENLLNLPIQITSKHPLIL